MPTQKQLFQLEMDVHGAEDDFEQTILRDYGVTIVDSSGAPWSIFFQGEREQLIKMVQDHWGDIELHPSEFIPVQTKAD